jgi:hypothetical protein
MLTEVRLTSIFFFSFEHINMLPISPLSLPPRSTQLHFGVGNYDALGKQELEEITIF